MKREYLTSSSSRTESSLAQEWLSLKLCQTDRHGRRSLRSRRRRRVSRISPSSSDFGCRRAEIAPGRENLWEENMCSSSRRSAFLGSISGRWTDGRIIGGFSKPSTQYRVKRTRQMTVSLPYPTRDELIMTVRVRSAAKRTRHTYGPCSVAATTQYDAQPRLEHEREVFCRVSRHQLHFTSSGGSRLTSAVIFGWSCFAFSSVGA